MNFLLDHDVPVQVAHLLRHWGHNVTRLPAVLPITATDEEVFGYACSKGLILISCNRNHFLALARQPQEQPGLIILIRRRTRQSACAHLSVLLQRTGENGLRNNVNFAWSAIPHFQVFAMKNIAFVSGKGGAGKTTLAFLLAWCLNGRIVPSVFSIWIPKVPSTALLQLHNIQACLEDQKKIRRSCFRA